MNEINKTNNFHTFHAKKEKEKNKEQTNTNKKAKYNIKMMENIKKKMNATTFLLN